MIGTSSSKTAFASVSDTDSVLLLILVSFAEGDPFVSPGLKSGSHLTA